MDYHNIHIHISMLPTSIVIVSLLLLATLPPSLSQPQPFDFSECSRKPYKCGDLPDLYYPFWGRDRPSYCGGGEQFSLTCEPDYGEYTSIQMGSQKFKVISIDPEAYNMRLVPLPLEYDVCSSPLSDFSLSHLFWYGNNSAVHNFTIFDGCPSGVPHDGNSFTCPGSDSQNQNGVYYEDVKDDLSRKHPELQNCGRRIQLPTEGVVVPDGDLVYALNEALREGFHVSYSVLSPECVDCLGVRIEIACEAIDMAKHPLSWYDCSNGSKYLECPASRQKIAIRKSLVLGSE